MGRNSLNIEDLFSEYSGLVTYIAEADRLLADPDIFVLASEMCDTSVFNYKNKVGSNGSGAGLTYQDAYYCTLGECAERYSLSVINPKNLIFGTYNELKHQYNITKPAIWQLFSKTQFANIPFPEFTEDTKIAWVNADNLLLKEQVLVPACTIYLPYVPHFLNQQEKILYPSVSTGAACSSSCNEAILKGIYELIERDAFLICWRKKLRIPEIVIDENSAIFNIFIDKFKRKHLEYRLFYTKLDMKAHSVFGILYVSDNQSTNKTLYCGGACHHDPNVAVIKTLLELAQGLKWGEYTKAERFVPNVDFSNIISFKDRMLLYATGEYNQAFDFLQNNSKINLSDIKKELHANTNDYLKDILLSLKLSDIDVFAIDVTPVDIEQCQLNVIKVLIPEFETMEGNYNWQFLGKNRYEELPKKLGFTLSQDNDYNPYPHPYP